jgi:hypothetical protein
MNRRRILASILGITSATSLCVLWFFILAPWQWRLNYPGGLLGWGCTLLGAAAESGLAAALGSRRWLYVLLLAMATFVYCDYARRGNVY